MKASMKRPPSRRAVRRPPQLASGFVLEQLPLDVLHRILATLPVSFVAAAAVSPPALAAAASTLPELGHVCLRLDMRTDDSARSNTHTVILGCKVT